MQIEEVDPSTAPDTLLEEMWKYYVPVYKEDLPDDPPVPKARQVNDWQHVMKTEAIPRWLLRDSSGIVGSGVAFYDLEQNLDNGHMRVHIRTDRRGEGLGRKLAAPILERLEDAGRKRVATYVKEGSSVEGFLESLGMKSAYREKRSRLAVDEVDVAEMQRWIQRAAERASEYDLLPLKIPYPEDVLETWCELQFQMNTAPREDFVEDDQKFTPDIWRDLEGTINSAEKDIDTLVAIHKPTGDWVGSTSIQTDRLYSAQAWQWETIVHPDHRNKGIGRWLKAKKIIDAMEEYPLIERVDTWNAGSNEPMLNINDAMGFKSILITNAYQGELGEVRRRLGV
ncbi:MAG: GNAT family N-acetyltransferase [Actinomycetota bacterium]|nr:GNAT family N-acetyltransferase [Actinomycetota bacterium]